MSPAGHSYAPRRGAPRAYGGRRRSIVAQETNPGKGSRHGDRHPRAFRGRYRHDRQGESRRVDRRPNTRPRRAIPGTLLVLKRAVHDPPLHIPRWSGDRVATRIDNMARTGPRTAGRSSRRVQRERIVGFVILGAKQEDDAAELVALFVTIATTGGTTIGHPAPRRAENRAREKGARADPSLLGPGRRHHRFYHAHGYAVIGIFDKSLARALPFDVIMARKL